MIDFSHLPNVHSGADVQVFRAPSMQAWVKPRGKSNVTIVAIGGGGGGGGGASGAQGTARGGGGGGSGGAFVTATLPAALVPDILYCLPGAGGLGATAAGVTGLPSFISTEPSAYAATTALIYAYGGSPGAQGLVTAGGAGGGAAPTGFKLASAAISQFTAVNGVAGASGGAHTGAVGDPISMTTANPAPSPGGTGGGGCTTTDFVGGYLVVLGTQFIAGGAVGGGAGQSGFELSPAGIFMPLKLYSTSGTGGGSNNTGVGGIGGRGGPGAGGGGGGAGVTGGRGGDGGHGLIMIVSW